MIIKLNQGHIAAIVVTLGLVAWMLLGLLADEEPVEPSRPLALDSGLQRVQVERMQGSISQYSISFSGHTAANRRVDITSEIRGKIIALPVQKGSAVKEGELLVELDSRDWPARVQQAEANLKQRRIEARGAKELANRGLAHDAQIAQAETALALAEAELTHAKHQLNAAKIRAPFNGIVDQRMVELGDFVNDGAKLMTLLDFTPWIVKGYVSERDVIHIHIGDDAWAELSNGTRINGRIRFISAEADPLTRMFAVEMEALNSNANMSSGLTARVFVPQPEIHAYRISPSLLVLDDHGKMGLKGIDANNKVVFKPIELLKADNKGLLVHGLGENSTIITVGQGFVDYGQTVEPVYPTENDHPPSDKTTLGAE